MIRKARRARDTLKRFMWNIIPDYPALWVCLFHKLTLMTPWRETHAHCTHL